MKLTASDAHAEADPVPELCQLDFCQLSSRVIQDSLMGHTDSSSEHGIRKPQAPRERECRSRGGTGRCRALATTPHAR